MIEDIMFGTKNPMLGARVGLSLLREILPWVYDEGCVLLSKLQLARTPAARKRILVEFEELLMFSTHNPYVEKYLIESEDDYRLFRELPRLLMHAVGRAAGEA